MNRLGLLILATLKQNCANVVVSSMSIYEIKEYAQLTQSTTTMHRAIQFLLSQEYVNKGIKDSKASTFYITQYGEEIIKEMI